MYYTNESIHIQVSPNYAQDVSVRIALGLTDKDDDSVLASPEDKNLLRVLKVGSTPKGKFAVIAGRRSK